MIQYSYTRILHSNVNELTTSTHRYVDNIKNIILNEGSQAQKNTNN